MAVGDFTKEEAKVVKDCIVEMFDAIPKRRQVDYIGHLNQALCFVECVAKVAPHHEEAKSDNG